MSSHASYRAVAKIKPSLPVVKVPFLCKDFLFFDCQNTDCPYSHEFALLEPIEAAEAAKTKVASDTTNVLRSATRFGYDRLPLESFSDLPGDQSMCGPRHDNDYQFVDKMSVLPTTDEVGCLHPFLIRDSLFNPG